MSFKSVIKPNVCKVCSSEPIIYRTGRYRQTLAIGKDSSLIESPITVATSSFKVCCERCQKMTNGESINSAISKWNNFYGKKVSDNEISA